jgi:hypothetical protein
MGLPDDLVFRAKGQLAIDIRAEALADGARFDILCGDEVLRRLHRAARVLRGPRPGVCAAGPVELPPHAAARGHANLRRGLAPIVRAHGRGRRARPPHSADPRPAGINPRQRPRPTWISGW